MKKVLIGLSWVYANGRLHIGHLGSSLPADVLARWHRLAGNDVAFVTGSDCFGTPILVSALAEGLKPEQLAEKYHLLLKQDFENLGFTFDNYSKTMSEGHQTFVQQFHAEMYGGEYIYSKSAQQLYCEKCNKYLPDRYVEGICPHCKKPAKGDSCDFCGKILEPEDLIEPKCKLCGGAPVSRETAQLYLKLSALQDKVEKFYDERKETWTANAQGLTGRYLNEGLVDRAITRNIEWGIPLPSDVPENKNIKQKKNDEWVTKRIYIWAENVLGYLSAAKEYCIKSGKKWEEFLVDGKAEALAYYVHAKDNIPFHSIILPGLMMANPITRYHLPDIIVSSEYIMLEGQKISKSKGNLLTVAELAEAFDADLIRFYFLRSTGDKKDANFTFSDFVNVINGELINNWGNLVNRTLSFIKNKFAGTLAKFELTETVRSVIQRTYDETGEFIEQGKINRALLSALELVNFGNKLFDSCKPWESVKTDIKKCKHDVCEVVSVITNCARILYPFVPDCCGKVLSWLGAEHQKKGRSWKIFEFEQDIHINNIEVLFARLDYDEVKQKFSKYV